MVKGKIGSKQITKSTDQFSVEDMITPTFVNDGDTTVRIMFSKIAPGESFALYFPPLILEGSIPVKFIDEPNKRNLVNVYFGTVKKECQ